MKAICFFILLFQFSAALADEHQLPIDLSAEELELELIKVSSSSQKNTPQKPIVVYPEIERIIQVGSRLSLWLKRLNLLRTKNQQIFLTSKEISRPITIEKPFSYSIKSITDSFDDLLNNLPSVYRDVLLGKRDFYQVKAEETELFIQFMRSIQFKYQHAIRFKLNDQRRAFFIRAARRDVRGYYFLVMNNYTAEKMKEFDLFSQTEKDKLANALTKICMNKLGDFYECESLLKTAIAEKKVTEFYQMYIDTARVTWHSFFKIPDSARRKDIVWKDTNTEFLFSEPKDPKFQSFIKNNIEEEFQFEDWKLKIIFSFLPDLPKLFFQAGTQPHVDKLGGNIITLDANQSTDEFESKWMIKHEFGHVLGLPDCYHEFYDVETKSYINYQLDSTNIMCSRTGRFNQRIFKELERNYR